MRMSAEKLRRDLRSLCPSFRLLLWLAMSGIFLSQQGNQASKQYEFCRPAFAYYPTSHQFMYHKKFFDSTSSPLGVYQVVTTIPLLTCWVRDSFKGLFEQFCLGMREDVAL